jgi:hypothetical protein
MVEQEYALKPPGLAERGMALSCFRSVSGTLSCPTRLAGGVSQCPSRGVRAAAAGPLCSFGDLPVEPPGAKQRRVEERSLSRCSFGANDDQ